MKRSRLHRAFRFAILIPAVAVFSLPVSAMMGTLPRVLPRAISLGDLTYSVYPRIITPNGDGANDTAGFYFNNPEDLPVQGEIYDLTGAKVADLKSSSDPALQLLWDGKDNGGNKVPGGIYLYQLDYQGNHATGTVVVAC